MAPCSRLGNSHAARHRSGISKSGGSLKYRSGISKLGGSLKSGLISKGDTTESAIRHGDRPQTSAAPIARTGPVARLCAGGRRLSEALTVASERSINPREQWTRPPRWQSTRDHLASSGVSATDREARKCDERLGGRVEEIRQRFLKTAARPRDHDRQRANAARRGETNTLLKSQFLSSGWSRGWFESSCQGEGPSM